MRLAWCVGLFEGEGSIVLGKPDSRGCRTRVVAVKMTDRDVIDRFQAYAGCGQVRGPFPKRQPHYKPIHEWTCSRWADIELLLTSWLPYLGERRREAAERMLACPAGPIGSPPQVTCRRGHERTEVNLYVDRRGNRHCRQCVRERRGSGVRVCVLCGSTDMPLGARRYCAEHGRLSSRQRELLIRRHPEWVGVFETRELKSA